MGHDGGSERRAGGPYGDPEFQAFAVKVAADHSGGVVEDVTAALLGDGWTIRSYGSDGRSFEVLGRHLSPADAWDRTYQLRARHGIAYAEPLFRAWITDRADWRVSVETDAPTLSGLLDELCGQGPDLPAARDTEWSLQQANVIRAWEEHFPGPSDPGAGVVVGHPDTGYRRHPEIAGNLLVGLGFDLFRNDPDPLDELAQGFGRSPGHGTSTASVIGSPRGPAGGVSGVAPGVGIIPFRVSDSVVVLDTLNLARAIEMAADAGAHVIAISMGGLGSERLHDAVVHATDKGAIVLAAAGNCVGFVVAPALYEEVVAVAACDAAGQIWRGSSRGAAVDITAPGDRVWRALADADDTLARVGQGSGTSYAVATVAGVAALWLARHGRDEIIRATGGPARIASAFRQLLRATAVPVPGWPTGQFGGGLVDAAALLAAPLPGGGLVPTLVPTAAEQPSVNRGGTATFVHLFENSMRADVSAQARNDASVDGLVGALAELLGTSPDKLPVDLGQVGQELAFHFATDPSLHHRFAAAAISVDAREESDDLVRAVGVGLIEKGVSPALHAKLTVRK